MMFVSAVDVVVLVSSASSLPTFFDSSLSVGSLKEMQKNHSKLVFEGIVTDEAQKEGGKLCVARFSHYREIITSPLVGHVRVRVAIQLEFNSATLQSTASPISSLKLTFFSSVFRLRPRHTHSTFSTFEKMDVDALYFSLFGPPSNADGFSRRISHFSAQNSARSCRCCTKAMDHRCN